MHEQIGQGALFLDRQVDFRWHPGSAFDSSERCRSGSCWNLAEQPPVN
ncbi:hypothetical protein [Mesorhizobium sp.]|nr:hypothetical protein [Mesorhizobium sp.]